MCLLYVHLLGEEFIYYLIVVSNGRLERFFCAHEIYAYLMNGYKQQYKNWFEVFQFKGSKYKSPFIILCIVYFRWFPSFRFDSIGFLLNIFFSTRE